MEGKKTTLEAIHRCAMFYKRHLSASFPLVSRYHGRKQLQKVGLIGLLGVFHMPVIYAKENTPTDSELIASEQKSSGSTASSAKRISDHAKVMEYLAKETGWERVKTMYTKTLVFLSLPP